MKFNEKEVQKVVTEQLEENTIKAEKFEHGVSRETWKATLESGKNVVISLFPQDKLPQDKNTHSYNPETLANAQKKLHDEGVSVPDVIKSGKTNDTSFIITEFVDGVSPKELDVKQIGAAAKAMAKSHAIEHPPILDNNDKMAGKPSGPRGASPVDDYMESHGNGDKGGNESKLLSYFKEVYDASNVKTNPDQKQVIHGNIQPAHLIYDEKTDKTTIVGWNRMREGDTSFDTGTFIAKTLFLPESPKMEKIKSFLKNYDSERPISNDDADKLQNTVLSRVIHTIALREKLPENLPLHTSYEKGIETLAKTKDFIEKNELQRSS